MGAIVRTAMGGVLDLVWRAQATLSEIRTIHREGQKERMRKTMYVFYHRSSLEGNLGLRHWVRILFGRYSI